LCFYPYAPVPWIKPSQRRFTEADLPDPEVRQQLLEHGRRRLDTAGFVEIGMDQYALQGDALAMAAANGTLDRNFMGYAPASMTPLLGLGSSAMGDAGTAFAQNEKNLMRYEARVDRGELPIQRGHVLDAEDLRLRHVISCIVNLRAVQWTASDMLTDWYRQALPLLAGLRHDGLIDLQANALHVTPRGLPFLRNVCLAFDSVGHDAA
jgi:oxygen-independent coproporphyrinogen III oxidase